MKQAKTKPQEVKRSERCDCIHPELIDTISVGVNGYFTFCTKCQREKRLTQNEIDKMIRDAK